MNGLMWFLYIASVLPSFALGLGMVLTLVGIFLFLYWGIWSINYNDRVSSVENPPPFKLLVWSIVCMFLVVSTTLVPDRDTIYMMAGAKGAELVVESEAGQEILDDIQQVIKHQLGELQGKTLTNQ